MTTTEGNKLIAEFMGWEDNVHSTISPDVSTDFNNTYKRFDSPDGKISLSYYWDDFDTELKYHFSWDWLMPVVEKIGGLGLSWDWKEYFENISIINTSIESVWNAVVEFLLLLNSEQAAQVSDTTTAQ